MTHNLQQAHRIADLTASLYLGELVEVAATDILVNQPARDQTADYVAGRFG